MDKILAQAKAIVGLLAVVVGSLAVSLPDNQLLKVAGGVIAAVAGYIAVYQTPNLPAYDPTHAKRD